MLYFYLVPTAISLVLATIITVHNIKNRHKNMFIHETRGGVLTRYFCCIFPLMNIFTIFLYLLYIMEVTGGNEWLDKEL